MEDLSHGRFAILGEAPGEVREAQPGPKRSAKVFLFGNFRGSVLSQTNEKEVVGFCSKADK